MVLLSLVAYIFRNRLIVKFKNGKNAGGFPMIVVVWTYECVDVCVAKTLVRISINVTMAIHTYT